MIVLGDADLAASARAAVWGAFAGAGQVCIRVERVLVEETVADELVRRIADETARLRLGSEGDFEVGRLTQGTQVERCRAQLADAVARGARVVAGGVRPEGLPERFFPPTVLDGVPPEAVVAREETFGPLLPILRVADREQAVRLANDSHLGLSGSVWSADRTTALALARRLQAGSVCINDVLVNYLFVSAPLGGAKQSGIGFRHGPEALRQFCRPRTVLEDRHGLAPLARWVRGQLGFPYRKGVLHVLRRLVRVIYR